MAAAVDWLSDHIAGIQGGGIFADGYDESNGSKRNFLGAYGVDALCQSGECGREDPLSTVITPCCLCIEEGVTHGET